jgi:hypothetical protein
VVHHVVPPAELRVLPGQRVEAVRAGHDHRARLRGGQGLDVRGREHLVEHLVARAPGRVAGAALAVAQHRERDAGGVQQLGHGPRRALRLLLVRACAADPEQVVDLGGGRDVRADDGHVERQPLRPVQPLPRGQAPRVAPPLELRERAAELCGERGLHEGLVPPDVDDGVDVLDVDRALLHAGAAGGARPERVRVDHAGGHQVDVDVPRAGLGAPGAGGPQVGRGRGGVVPERERQQLGGERLAGGPRRALVLAPAALRAGGDVEQLLPGQVLDGAGAEPRVVRQVLQRGDVEVAVADPDGRERPEGRGARRRPAGVDVQHGQKPVPGDAHRGLQADDDEPRHGHQDLHGRAQHDGRLDRGERRPRPQPADPRGGGEVPGARERGAVADRELVLQAAQQQHRQYDEQHGRLDDDGLRRARPEEPGPPLRQRGRVRDRPRPVAGPGADGGHGPRGRRRQPPRRPPDAHRDQRQDPRERQPGDPLGQPLPRREVPQQRQRPPRVDHLRVPGDQREEQDGEGHHDDPVRGADHRGVLEPAVPDHLAHDEPRPPTERAQPARRGAADADGPGEPACAESERPDPGDGGREHHDEAGHPQQVHVITLIARGAGARDRRSRVRSHTSCGPVVLGHHLIESR